jgi:CheY-like chemotaxis protein
LADAGEPEVPLAGQGRILVVDDEEELAEVAMAYLASFGYETGSARSGEEALRALSADANYDLVLTDIVMPGGMDGMELHRRVARQYPAVRFVYASGFSDAALQAKSGGSLKARLVSKPYRREDLVRVVRAALDTPPANFSEGEIS